MSNPKETTGAARDKANDLLHYQTITLSNGEVVAIQERVLKILGGAEIVLLRAGYQTDESQELFYRGRQNDLMAKIKSTMMHEMGSQIMKICPIVQVEIPVIEALPSESTLRLTGQEKPKRFMTQIPVLVPKEKKKGDPGDPN